MLRNSLNNINNSELYQLRRMVQLERTLSYLELCTRKILSLLKDSDIYLLLTNEKLLRNVFRIKQITTGSFSVSVQPVSVLVKCANDIVLIHAIVSSSLIWGTFLFYNYSTTPRVVFLSLLAPGLISLLHLDPLQE